MDSTLSSSTPIPSNAPQTVYDRFQPQRVLRSIPTPLLTAGTRAEVRAYFENTWQLTESLFSSLSEDGWYQPPRHGLRHPMIFYYGHSAVFYMNKLREAGLVEASLDPYFEDHFAVGVDENSWDDMSKNSKQWPTVSEVRAYRDQVHQLVGQLIETTKHLAPEHSPIDEVNPLWSLFMAIEHERIHIETSSVLIRELPQAFVSQPENFPALHPSSARASTQRPVMQIDYPENTWIRIPKGNVHVGRPENWIESWPVFGWDNEFGSDEREVEDFAVSRFMISNGEFLDFVMGGGYQERNLWSETGWAWKEGRNIHHPTFWVPRPIGATKEFALRTCFETIEMQWDWPAIVNFHEAKAYAAWKTQTEGHTCRLLREAEHIRLREHVAPSREWEHHEGWYGSDRIASSALLSHANIDLRWSSESPVDHQAVEDGRDVCDVFGNVWQWCEDTFHPLQGFKAHALYPDYSAPSFDGEHQMIMGGSFISTGAGATPWVRSHFRPHFFQHAGFRLVRSDFA